MSSPRNSDDYGFIMDQPNQAKPKKLAGGPSWRGRVLIVVGILIAIIVAALVFSAQVANQNTRSTVSLATVALRQSELIDAAKIGAKGSTKNSPAQILASTTQRTIEADYSNYATSLSASGIKVPKGAKDSVFAQTMTDARLANRFESTFILEMLNKLNAYKRAIEAAYPNAQTTEVKQALTESYDHATVLIESQGSSETGVLEDSSNTDSPE